MTPNKLCAECRGPKDLIDSSDHVELFCSKCKAKKCENCLIVLSARYKCVCGEKHGKPSSDRRYCLNCVENNLIHEPSKDNNSLADTDDSP